MKEKALVLTSVASMIQQFNLENIKLLQKLGYEVHVIANFQEPGTITSREAEKLKLDLELRQVKVYDIDIKRFPLSIRNIKAYIRIKKIFSANSYKLAHVQSPIGGVLGRLAGIKYRKTNNLKVIYTAHGFHFYVGASIFNWILYYPIEKIMANVTDILITINNEDFRNSRNFNSVETIEIPGVGIDYEQFANERHNYKKSDFGIPQKAKVIVSTGELNKNKNHEIIIRAISNLKLDIYYLICGKGKLEEDLKELSKDLNISDRIIFLGYRDDLSKIYKMADLFAFPSRREGLGLACLEAMASGLPIVSSNVGGINSYSEDGCTGFKFAPDDVDGFSNGIKTILEDTDMAIKFGNNNKIISKKFSKEIVNNIMVQVYR